MPTLISRLPVVSSVACGASVGYAVSKDGKWGSSGLVGFWKVGVMVPSRFLGMLYLLSHGVRCSVRNDTALSLTLRSSDMFLLLFF